MIADRTAAPDQTIRRIAIVGGGTAGWVAASMLARALPGSGCEITVVESPEIGTVGVGEAIIALPRFLGINEADFVRHTDATYKLGIVFHDRGARAGNGYVYSSAYLSDAAAFDDLLAQVGEAPMAEPRFLRFVTGRRRRFWQGNCVSLGLPSGFPEPLESTSIHLAISGVYALLDDFPDHGFATRRDDSPLWRYGREMPLPDTLRARIDHYSATGRIRPAPGELFTDTSWFHVFEGMGVRPARYDPRMDVVPPAQLREVLGALARATGAAAAAAPSHHSHFAEWAAA
jgi:hypothetical protein